jgi:hypothetical protein
MLLSFGKILPFLGSASTMTPCTDEKHKCLLKGILSTDRRAEIEILPFNELDTVMIVSVMWMTFESSNYSKNVCNFLEYCVYSVRIFFSPVTRKGRQRSAGVFQVAHAWCIS